MALPAETRFWMRVNKEGPLHPTLGNCWDWTGNVLRHKDPRFNYGRLSIGNKQTYATRLSWELHNGLIPKGLWILHHCDRPICVNPKHLYLGTHSDNMADAVSRDRLPFGEQNHRAKLTEEAVREIRRRYVRGSRENGSVALARESGVSNQLVSRILCGGLWKRLV
jgi:hypothetical protein